MSAISNSPVNELVRAIATEVVRQLHESDIRLLTVPQAAKYIGRSPRAMYHLISTRVIPAHKEGRAVRLDRRELDAWIENQQYRG